MLWAVSSAPHRDAGGIGGSASQHAPATGVGNSSQLRAQPLNDRDWVREFEQSRGRPLRVLHVGNIANNAYLNAKFLRGIGVECHVLCFDYYDRFATPEWEDGNGVRRPRWFVQGPFRRCAAYLDAALSERRWQRWFRWHRLSLARAFQTRLTTGRTLPSIRFWAVVARYKLRFARSWLWSLTRFLTRRTLRLVGFNIKEPRVGDPAEVDLNDEPAELEVNASPERQRLVKRFVEAFPARRDSLSLADFAAWDRAPDVWRGLFERYDIVQCYATEPIRALLAAKRPYVAYEHGTLRDFTMGDDPTHRLNALAYRDSDHVFITNGDCLSFAEALGIPRFSPMVHPVDIDQHERDLGEEPRRLRDSLGADVLLLCPLRHDWAIKGTDIHIRALPRIVEENAGRVVMVLTTWGAQVDESARLISELGCGRYVKWLPPLDRLGLITHMKAADVLLDQMVLPHFGATAPQGLAAGVPVIMSYRPESTEWIVDEPAPILAAFDPDGVAEAVRTALDPAWRREFALRAREWVHRYHHPNRVVIEHCRVYRQLLER